MARDRGVGVENPFDQQEDLTLRDVDQIAYSGAEAPSDKRLNVQPRGATLTSDGHLKIGGFILTPLGLRIGEGVTLESWRKVGEQLRKLESGIQWLIGDWLVYGESRKHGETTKELAAWSDRELKTLWNYAAVARSVDYSLRQDVLTFGHHNLVAGLARNEQVEWLQRAVTEGWSVAAMRKAMRPVVNGINWDDEVGRSAKAIWNGVDRIKEAQGVEAAMRFVIRQGEILDEIMKSLQGGG